MSDFDRIIKDGLSRYPVITEGLRKAEASEALIFAAAAPILFLDVDGVLNCEATFFAPKDGRHRICRERIALLNDVIATSRCRVVMSSAWRVGRPDVRGILRRYGLKARFCLDWRTPYRDHTFEDRRRGSEIADWLKRNGSPSYAIVDDDSDMLPEQMPRFVQTSFETGLTREHADRLIALLSVAGQDQAVA